MWKYECKRHLLYLLIAAIAGGVLFGLTIDGQFCKRNEQYIRLGSYHNRHAGL